MEKQIESPSAIQPQEDPPTWTHLSRFQVQYLERVADNTIARVFRNGRQQVPITIIIEGRNANDEVVVIPATDLAKTELILYHTQEALPSGIEVRSWRNNTFEYYPESTLLSEPYTVTQSSKDVAESTQRQINPDVAAESLLPIATPMQDTILVAQTYSLWLTTTLDQTLRIGAQLPSPAGGRIHTCSPDVEGGGWSQGGAFNSSVSIQPQAPTPHSLSEFSMFREDIYSPDSNYDIDVYTVGFVDKNYLIKDVIQLGLVQQGWFYANYVGGRHNHFHYIFDIGIRTAKHFKNGDHNQLLEFPVNTRAAAEGLVSLARVTELNSGRVVDAEHTGKVEYFDQYANKSIIYIRPSDNGNQLYLSDH